MTKKQLTLPSIIVIVLGLGIIWLAESRTVNSTVPEAESDLRESDIQDMATFDKLELSSGWTVTSYQDVNEAVYTGNKVQVFDSDKNSLGYYKSDFLEQVQIDGSGKGDGIRNSGKVLHYDYEVDDGKTYYQSDISMGAFGNELVPWTGDKPSIAINPPLPPGTIVRFKILGSDAGENPQWVNELLLSKTFYADDHFFGVTEKRIDVYVGLQKQKDISGTPESLFMNDVTIEIQRVE